MTNVKFAALAASLIVVTAPAMAQGEKTLNDLYGATEAGVDWAELGASEDGGVASYHHQPDNDQGFGLEGAFARSADKTGAFDLQSDDEWSPSLAEGKPFGSGNNLLFREAGDVEIGPGIRADAIKNMHGWRFSGGYERLLTDALSLRLSREYTTFGNDFDQWQTKAGLLVKF